ncbi:lytic transglycosylase domain-containing protein [Endomicrobium proavitum]|uniref:LysM domain-containing protein n=1 Tax=Endomicrobium proavitum TaxID=1408281 RepID=A0A0G3WJY5_9BACT|nr:lytic transglycosylase domain-containing protein [Endomicrobium proavitum]AKL98205.1 exported protein of unknown function [Endomicrobium proavitum]
MNLKKKTFYFFTALFICAAALNANAQEFDPNENQETSDRQLASEAIITAPQEATISTDNGDNSEPVITTPEESVSLSWQESADPLVSAITSALADAPQQQSSKKAILEASSAYRKSVEAYKKGDFKTAKKQFSNFTNKLEKAEINSELYYFLFDDLESILTKLNRIYSIDEPLPYNGKDKPSIPMECEDNSLVEKYINVYSVTAKKNMQTALERSGAYRAMILKTLQEFNLPEELLYLPIVESLFYNGDVSHAGAVGLWQIMPHRGRALGLQINYWIDERKDPQKATRAACLYLKELYIMLNDWHLVLAAYNRGEYGLIRDMKFSNATNITEMTDRNAIPKETQRYVPQFIAVVTVARDLKKYGFTNLNYAAPAAYDVYKTDKVIDLKIAAQCAQTTIEEIKKLNPALNAWCTPQGYPGFELKIPYGSKEKFLENIAKTENLNPSPGFIKHKVVKGEYLEKIAKLYATTPSEIKKDNPQLNKQKYLKLNQVLIVRPGKKYFK